MLRGLANVNLVAADVPAAIEWYSTLLGGQPYFVQPPEGPLQYAEWRFGDDEDELAIMDAAFRPVLESPGGAVVSIHVDDMHASAARVLELGATEFEPVTERAEGWWSASFVDPFGNVLGLIQSPHWAGRHER